MISLLIWPINPQTLVKCFYYNESWFSHYIIFYLNAWKMLWSPLSHHMETSLLKCFPNNVFGFCMMERAQNIFQILQSSKKKICPTINPFLSNIPFWATLKHQKTYHFLPPDTHTYMDVSGCEKIQVFWSFQRDQKGTLRRKG